MKKKIAALLTTAFVMAMSVTTVFAAGSPTVTTETKTVVEVETEGVTSKEVTNPEAKNTAAAIAKESVTLLQDKSAKPETAKIAVLTDLSLPEGTTIPEGGLKVTFSVPSVTSNMGVLVYNFRDGAWQWVEGATAGNGSVTVTFTHLSPVMVVTYEKDATLVDTDSNANTGSNAGTTAGTTTGGATTSPKTGVLPVAAMTAGICLAGAAVCGKKVKFN